MSETMAKSRVAILGLGIMGTGMANRLLSADFPLTVYNRNREKSVSFADGGAFVAASPREAASRSVIILSMVGDDAASRGIWLGENGALAGAAPGSVLIESSTLSGDWIQELAIKAAERGCRFLDAPVTGTKPHAASGELVFLVGGSAEAVDAARPVFSVLGRDVVHLGPVGSGSLMKLINNFVCGVQAASFAEAVAMIDAGGLDRAKAISILTGGAPGSGIVKRMADRIAAGDFTPNFALRWMAKDIGYAIDDASKNGIALQTAAAALSVFKQAIAEGHGDEDFSAVSKSSKKRSNS
jgi:3-hydroxyisobutyrate dehydrogenase